RVLGIAVRPWATEYPLRAMGSVDTGVPGNGHRHQHACGVVVDLARDLARRPDTGDGRVDARELGARLDRLVVVGGARPLPAAADLVERRPGRLDAVRA